MFLYFPPAWKHYIASYGQVRTIKLTPCIWRWQKCIAMTSAQVKWIDFSICKCKQQWTDEHSIMIENQWCFVYFKWGCADSQQLANEGLEQTCFLIFRAEAHLKDAPPTRLHCWMIILRSNSETKAAQVIICYYSWRKRRGGQTSGRTVERTDFPILDMDGILQLISV